MLDENIKNRMLGLFIEGHSPYKIAKLLKLHQSTIRYNMYQWLGRGVLRKITPGTSTPIMCEAGHNYHIINNGNNNHPDHPDLSITPRDIMDKLHLIENYFIEHLHEVRKEIKEIRTELVEMGGNGSLIQNKIIIDKKSLSISNADVRDMTRYLKRRTLANNKK